MAPTTASAVIACVNLLIFDARRVCPLLARGSPTPGGEKQRGALAIGDNPGEAGVATPRPLFIFPETRSAASAPWRWGYTGSVLTYSPALVGAVGEPLPAARRGHGGVQ